MTQKGFDPNDIRLILKFNSGEINHEDYSKRRGLGKNEKLVELNYLVNDNHYMLNEFLSNISIGLRCVAMKGLFNLTDIDIETCVDFRKSSIGYFIKNNKMPEKVVSTRLDVICRLSIVFDLPFRYLAHNYTEYEMVHSFSEYDALQVETKNLQELIGEILLEMKSGIKSKRNIYGVKIVNDFFKAGRKKELYSRVDIRREFFTVEIHLENEANINNPELLKLEKSLGVKNEIYIRNAFLRDNKKLYILIPLVEALQHNVIYLPKEFLWRNVLNGLNTEVMEKVKRIEEDESKVNFD